MSFAGLSVLFIVLGLIDPPKNILEVVGGWLLIAWFGAALAITLGALSHESELVEKLWHPASYLIFPLSGAAFLVDALPEVAQKYVLLIPMVHGTEIVREGYFGSRVNAHYDLGYVLPFCLVLTFVALVATRWVAARVVPE